MSIRAPEGSTNSTEVVLRCSRQPAGTGTENPVRSLCRIQPAGRTGGPEGAAGDDGATLVGAAVAGGAAGTVVAAGPDADGWDVGVALDCPAAGSRSWSRVASGTITASAISSSTTSPPTNHARCLVRKAALLLPPSGRGPNGPNVLPCVTPATTSVGAAATRAGSTASRAPGETGTAAAAKVGTDEAGTGPPSFAVLSTAGTDASACSVGSDEPAVGSVAEAVPAPSELSAGAAVSGAAAAAAAAAAAHVGAGTGRTDEISHRRRGAALGRTRSA